MKNTKKYFLSLFVITGLGCSVTEFDGASSKKSSKSSIPPAESQEKEAQPQDGADGEQPEKDLTDDIPTPDQTVPEPGLPKAIQECIKSWPDAPFTASELENPKIVNLDQSNKNNGLSYSDRDPTEKPVLILINIGSKNVNQGTIETLNPNGWYCIDLKAKIANNFTIRAGCSSKIATLDHSAQVSHSFNVVRPNCTQSP